MKFMKEYLNGFFQAQPVMQNWPESDIFPGGGITMYWCRFNTNNSGRKESLASYQHHES